MLAIATSVVAIFLFAHGTASPRSCAPESCSPGPGLPVLVAEYRRVVTRPLPHRGRAGDRRILDLRLVAETARVDADRAEPELPAAVGELLEEPLERRAAVARLADRVSGKPETDGLLGRPDHDVVVALLECRGRDEERERDLLGVLHPRREVDQNLSCHSLLLRAR